MKNLCLRTLLLSALLIFPTLSFADTGFYASLKPGVSKPGDLKFSDSTTYQIGWFSGYILESTQLSTIEMDALLKAKIEYDYGFSLSGSFGYDFGKLRIDGEVAYSNNKVKSSFATYTTLMADQGSLPMVIGEVPYNDYDYVNIPIAPQNLAAHMRGDISMLKAMANCYYEFENQTRFTPYIMGGLGAVWLKVDDALADDHDTVFAYQAGLGLSTAINEKWALEFGYTYFKTADAEIELNRITIGDSYKTDFDSHNLNVGLKYFFN
ncbi:MAG: hypothetical protein C0622_10900 [Desulfuromonas sp.]|nr:MAG: hypothetical protein C0622_10900 [Desulfuromonas sp.]